MIVGLRMVVKITIEHRISGLFLTKKNRKSNCERLQFCVIFQTFNNNLLNCAYFLLWNRATDIGMQARSTSNRKRSHHETPLRLKINASRKRQPTDLQCLVHYAENTSDKKVKHFSEKTWQTIKEAAFFRSNSVKFDEPVICSEISQFRESLPATKGFHLWCYKKFTNISKLRKDSEEQQYLDTVTDVAVTREKNLDSSVSKPFELFPPN